MPGPGEGSAGGGRAQTDALRAWATGIAARRGKKIAVVALARRLAGILYAMLARMQIWLSLLCRSMPT